MPEIGTEEDQTCSIWCHTNTLLFTELGITTRMLMHCLGQQDSLLQQKEDDM